MTRASKAAAAIVSMASRGPAASCVGADGLCRNFAFGSNLMSSKMAARGYVGGDASDARCDARRDVCVTKEYGRGSPPRRTAARRSLAPRHTDTNSLLTHGTTRVEWSSAEPGILEGWTLSFNQAGWPPAEPSFANVVPLADGGEAKAPQCTDAAPPPSCHGVVYTMTPQHFDTLWEVMLVLNAAAATATAATATPSAAGLPQDDSLVSPPSSITDPALIPPPRHPDTCCHLPRLERGQRGLVYDREGQGAVI
mmetsp:Transcript_79625/g.227343  ORF Transcript_79625/g.227343 Transcript_79625/m.227343 type:complete len:253 (+) Transcript_79625:39-797(+)